MKEAKFLGTLMPMHPDLQPIIQEIRIKYNDLPEINPEDEPIKEIFLGDKQVSLEDFLTDIQCLIETKTEILPQELATYYRLAKPGFGKPLDYQGRELPDDVVGFINAMYGLLQNQMAMVIPFVEKFYRSIAQMLYVYILTGETEEVPENWISQAVVTKMYGNDVVLMVANQTANPEVVVQQFRTLFKKTFKVQKSKVTNNVVSTAYYLRLKALGKPNDFILEEYIRRNKFSLPKDKKSKRYYDVQRKYAERLKKQMQRSKAILDVLLRDKN
jgi:hypothetical protein